MPIDPADLFTALDGLEGVDEVFDTKRPDNYDLTGTILVFSNVSETPDVPLDLELLGGSERWQVSVYGVALADVRTVKGLVIAALHGYEAGSIQSAEYDGSPGHLYDAESLEYHIPLDFLLES